VMQDLGTLGGLWSGGAAINDAGDVAGSSATLPDSWSHAFRYVGMPGSGGVMQDLGTLGGPYSFGSGINAAGHVVGSARLAGDVASRAFLYVGTPGSGGVMHDLGALGGSDSVAYDINDAGQISGFAYRADNNAHAFRYVGTPGSGGVMQDLGTLGGPTSSGEAINASGQVVGASSVTADDQISHAFRYTGTAGGGGVMEDLGELVEGGGINAMAINDAGDVAGTSGVGGGVFHAFLYTGTPGRGGRMHDLDAWLDATNPAEGAKWTLISAEDLDDAGLVVGYGEYDDGPGGLTDGTRAFLLDASSLVPEPSSAALIGLGGLALLRRRFGGGRDTHGPEAI
ncbi:MAG TPA: PEP-CTERM sorting domain-containing protein, partial [Tepidisphaeraceae bacterium]|nr:PEP-CTERM sorting domain-containing protein [Tepidisphaeraceae bacterium]